MQQHAHSLMAPLCVVVTTQRAVQPNEPELQPHESRVQPHKPVLFAHESRVQVCPAQLYLRARRMLHACLSRYMLSDLGASACVHGWRRLRQPA